jgi:serine/threonine-protein kinase HipA
LVPSVQGLGQQQIRVGKNQADASIDNALSEVQAFGLAKDAAIEATQRVAASVDGWKEFFLAQGVSRRDIDQMAQYIDGPHLKAQRAEFIGRLGPARP